MKKLGWALCLLIFAVVLHAQDKPTITVLDFQVNNISQGDMKLIVSLLSSALFRTGKFRVIDVSQRDTILKELEFSSQDCTDESCQLEIGKLLSAEMIVVGNIGSVGKRYLVASKVLQTETGNTLSAVDGVYSSLEELIDKVQELGGSLAAFLGEAGPAVAQKPAAEPKAQPVAAPEAAAPAAAPQAAAPVAAPEAPAAPEAGTAPAEEKPAAEEVVQAPQPEAPPAAPETKRIARPAARKPGVLKKAFAFSFLGTGTATAGAGGILVAVAVRYRATTVAGAYNDYQNAPALYSGDWAATTVSEREAFFTELYTAYSDSLERYRRRVILGASLAGGGVALLATSALLFVLPERARTESVGLRFMIEPGVDHIGLLASYRY